MTGFAHVLKANPYGINQYTKGKMYRGEGKESSTSGDLMWVTPDKDLAKGYADKRTDGKVSEVDVDLKGVFDAGHDARKVTPSKFSVEVLSKAKQNGTVDDATALALRKDFLAGQGKDEVDLHSLWADDEGKKRVSTLLSGAGFDSIHVTENDKPTFGIIKKPKAVKSDSATGFAHVLKANLYGVNQYTKGTTGDPSKASALTVPTQGISVKPAFARHIKPTLQSAAAALKSQGITMEHSGMLNHSPQYRLTDTQGRTQVMSAKDITNLLKGK